MITVYQYTCITAMDIRILINYLYAVYKHFAMLFSADKLSNERICSES